MSIDKIICVGKNYLEHAKEFGEAIPTKPVLFLKPESNLIQSQNWGTVIEAKFPEFDNAVQPECEIVLRVANDAYCMTFEEANKNISHVSLGLDMTLRNRQFELKKQGHPWTTAKVFFDAAILCPWISLKDFDNFLDQDFQLILDDVVTQCAKGQDMMMKPVDLLMYISQFFPLKAGDIIYTGTPAGVHSISKNTHAKLIWGNYSQEISWY